LRAHFSVLPALVAFLPVAALAQNVVLNPGFESGNAPWVFSSYGGAGGQPWSIGSSFFGLGPHSGSRFASTGCNLASCVGPDSGVGAWLYQDLATVSGATYALTFYFTPGLGSSGAEFQVLWGPSATPLTIGPSGTCGGNCVYRSTSIGTRVYSLVTVPNLTATSTSMRLEFIGEQQPDVNGVDDVCVGTGSTCLPSASVPVLSAGMMGALAAGLLAMAFFLFHRFRAA